MLHRISEPKKPFTVCVLFFAALIVTLQGLPAPAQVRNVLVFGAASLKDALDNADARYLSSNGHKIVVSYGASSTLAKQIDNGAPADVFISADLDWMDYLSQRSLIKPETRFNFLGNKLVLIARADDPIKLAVGPNFPLARALGTSRLAIADPASVPAGRYGKAALESLGVWASVEGKLAPAQDVRATLAFVSRGEAPLGIVYQTDATADKAVKIVGEFPESSYPPIVYPLAVTRSSANPGTADYIAFLKSSAARPDFEKQGFVMLQ